MDEKTPHMHLCFVPLTRDKRLSAKEILGNKKSMIRWQDDFYACMAERWPELERGTPAVETKRRHLTPQWYKKVTAMDAKLEQLEATLNNINVINAGKKREEAVALLAQLLPEVESFQAETQRLQDTIAHERRNASFQREINADLRMKLLKQCFPTGSCSVFGNSSTGRYRGSSIRVRICQQSVPTLSTRSICPAGSGRRRSLRCFHSRIPNSCSLKKTIQKLCTAKQSDNRALPQFFPPFVVWEKLALRSCPAVRLAAEMICAGV